MRPVVLVPPKRGGLWWKVPLTVIGGLAVLMFGLGFLGFFIYGGPSDASPLADAPVQSTQADSEAEAERSAREFGAAADELVAETLADEVAKMEAAGWTSMGNQLFYVTAPSGEANCGSTPCAGFSVVSQSSGGCLGGIYMKVSFLTENEVSVGSGSQITASLAQGQQAVFKIHDYSLSATSVNVTGMSCL